MPVLLQTRQQKKAKENLPKMEQVDWIFDHEKKLFLEPQELCHVLRPYKMTFTGMVYYILIRPLVCKSSPWLHEPKYPSYQS